MDVEIAFFDEISALWLKVPPSHLFLLVLKTQFAPLPVIAPLSTEHEISQSVIFVGATNYFCFA